MRFLRRVADPERSTALRTDSDCERFKHLPPGYVALGCPAFLAYLARVARPCHLARNNVTVTCGTRRRTTRWSQHGICRLVIHRGSSRCLGLFSRVAHLGRSALRIAVAFRAIRICGLLRFRRFFCVHPISWRGDRSGHPQGESTEARH